MWTREVCLILVQKLECQKLWSPLKVTQRNVVWNLLTNQRERSSILWLTNSSDEREIFEIDVGDPLESEKSFCRDSSVSLSKRLSDGKLIEVTFHSLLPGQQSQLDEAMTKELSQVLAADAVRRLTQEELDLNAHVAHALGPHVEMHRGWREEGKSAALKFLLTTLERELAVEVASDEEILGSYPLSIFYDDLVSSSAM